MKSSLMSSISSAPKVNIAEYGDFPEFLSRIRRNVPEGVPLFTVSTEGIWQAYIRAFPVYARQEYNCRSCRKFLENYGGLMYLDSNGKAHSALWTIGSYGEFDYVVDSLRDLVSGREITTQVLASEKFLGETESGGWDHLSIPTPPSVSYSSVLKTANQAMAAKREDFRMLDRALNKYSENTTNKALAMLRGDKLYRSEKAVKHAEWMAELRYNSTQTRRRSNVIWAAIAGAPAMGSDCRGSCRLS